MFWSLRFVLMDDDTIALREVYFDNNGNPLGHSEPYLAGDEGNTMWPTILSEWVVQAAKLPVLMAGDIGLSRQP